MSKTLQFSITLSDEHVDAIETVKSLMITNPDTGITNETSLEEVYCELANVGLARMSMDMMKQDIYSRHRHEVELGNEVDAMLDKR